MTPAIVRLLLVDGLLFLPLVASRWPETGWGRRLVPFAALVPAASGLVLRWVVETDAEGLLAIGQPDAAATQLADGARVVALGLLSSLAAFGVVWWRSRGAPPVLPSPPRGR